MLTAGACEHLLLLHMSEKLHKLEIFSMPRRKCARTCAQSAVTTAMGCVFVNTCSEVYPEKLGRVYPEKVVNHREKVVACLHPMCGSSLQCPRACALE